MTILSIETSLDETAAAVLDGDRVLSSVVWSQLKLHQRWGGVVPSIARRAHEERLPGVVAAALRRAHLSNSSNLSNLTKPLTVIAVTVGPGLAPALEVGIAFAKQLAREYRKPLIPVSHLEGHIASVFLRRRSGAPYVSNLPNWTNLSNWANWLSLIVSGGHTELVISKLKTQNSKPNSINHQSLTINHFLLGATLDDAAGECFDKVGRELGLGYPAGPVVEKLAAESVFKGPTFGNQRSDLYTIQFPIPLERSPKTDLNFSFSGLKTAAVQWLHQSTQIRSANKRGHIREMSRQEIVNFCASFQNAVIEALLLKVRRAVKMTGIKTLLLSGGVAANNELRRRVRQTMRQLGGQAFCAPKKFTGDNAAMIGLAAQWVWERGEAARKKIEIEKIDREPNLNFPSSTSHSISFL